MKRILLIAIVGSLFMGRASAQKLAAEIDPLWLAMGVANAGAELAVGRCSTLGLSVTAFHHPWVNDEGQGVGLHPELRYYLSGRSMYHLFVGVSGLTGTYSLHFNDKHYVGSAAGLGLTFGYVLPINRRFNIDFHSGFGVIHTQDRERGHDNLTLPTKVGVTITYILQ